MQLFDSADHALIFALRFATQQYAESPMSKSLKTHGAAPSSGKGLVGLEGAGVAGSIKRRLEQLSDPERAILTARFTERKCPCPTCGSDAATSDYRGAIITLAAWAEQFVSNADSVQRMRYAIVQAYFEGTRISKVAKQINVPTRTAYDQKAKIHPQLVDLEKTARTSIDALLTDLCLEEAGA